MTTAPRAQELWTLLSSNTGWFEDLLEMNSCDCRLDAANPECSYRADYPTEHALVRNVLRLLQDLDAEDAVVGREAA